MSAGLSAWAARWAPGNMRRNVVDRYRSVDVDVALRHDDGGRGRGDSRRGGVADRRGAPAGARRHRVARGARPAGRRLSHADGRRRGALPVLDTRLHRERIVVLRLAELVPRPGDRHPGRDPDHAVGADDRSRPPGRCAAVRGRDAGSFHRGRRRRSRCVLRPVPRPATTRPDRGGRPVPQGHRCRRDLERRVPRAHLRTATS